MKRQITRETVMIREARIRMGYSQQEVAALAGVHIRQYQRLEYGERDPGAGSVPADLRTGFPSALGITIFDLRPDGRCCR